MKLLVFFIFFAVTGCSSSWKEEQNNFKLFTDIPIPAHSILNKKETVVLKNKRNWKGILTFSFRNKVRILYHYYFLEMKNFGWKKIAVLKGDFENYSLIFSKEDRIVQIGFKFNQIDGTQVKITMHQKEFNSI